MILITGATGLVGSNLALHLLENGEAAIRCIYRKEIQIERTKVLFELYNKIELFDKIDWVKADILDIPSLEIAFINVAQVYHCAAKISFNPNDEKILRKTNIKGTANIVNFCIDKKVKKLCHVSSIAALGDLAQHENTITENSEWNKEILHSDYAISKYGAEIEVFRAQQEGVAVVIVNPGIILGAYPKNWNKNNGSGALFTTVKKGISFYTTGSTGYVSVTDVVKIMRLLMLSSIENERFIVVAENKSYQEIIFSIAKKMNVKPPRIEAKPWLLSIACKLDWLASLLFISKRKLSKSNAQSLVTTDVFSNKKIIETLNYTFEPVEETLKTVVSSFK